MNVTISRALQRYRVKQGIEKYAHFIHIIFWIMYNGGMTIARKLFLALSFVVTIIEHCQLGDSRVVGLEVTLMIMSNVK